MGFIKAGISWFRTSIAWSNSRASWHERLVLALFLAIAIGLGFLSAWIGFWPAVALWAVYFAVVTLGSRQGWLQLFGPVLFYDMIRTARQSRYVVMRLIYAGLLLFILCFLYLNITATRHGESRFLYGVLVFAVFVFVVVTLVSLLRVVTSRAGRLILATLIVVGIGVFFVGFSLLDMDDGQPGDRRQTAVLAETFFAVFMIVQLVMVALLTPAYVGGAIADEKDRKTLEFMLATDLNNHEIILSKLLSRLANITLFLLTGLPILSILQFLGGVDAELMLLGFAGTGLTMLGIGSVSILFSTLFQRPRDAIGMSYVAIIAYLALATVGKVLILTSPWFMSYGLWLGDDGPTLTDVARFINTGNPIAAVIDISLAIERASLMADLPMILTDYAWFHGILSAVCIVWSIARLRAIALKQTVAGTTKKLGRGERPVIGTEPMIWKEMHIDGGMKFNWAAWIAVGLLVLVTVSPGVIMMGGYVWSWFVHGGDHWHRFSEEMNIWFRIAGTSVTGLLLLRVAVHASTSISSERERDTFDALLATPLSSEAILGAKLLGCLTSMRIGWIWLGSMVAMALVTRALHPLAVPILVVAWLIYATFFSMIGLWFSMVCKTSMRATLLTVLTSLFLGGGHWLFAALCCYFPASILFRGSNPGDWVEDIAKFQAGMTPPFVIGFCAYSWEDLAVNFHSREDGNLILICFLGLFVWAMAGVSLWYGLLLPKFRKVTRREVLIHE